MDKQRGMIVTMNFGHDTEDVLGKLVIAPTQQAELVWEKLCKYPDKYAFAFGYIEGDDGKQLMDISLIPRNNNEQATIS